MNSSPPLLFFDAETFYSDEYQLRKMSTQEYILDERFHVHGASVCTLDSPYPIWLEGDELTAFIQRMVPKCILVGHNLKFDGGILAWHYGVYPVQYQDTLAMSRALNGARLKSHSLDNISTDAGDEGKQKFLAIVKGVRHLNDYQKRELKKGCNHDVALTRARYKEFIAHMPPKELEVIDWSIRIFTQPKLILNTEKLAGYYNKVLEDKETALERAGLTNRDMLMSNPQYGQALINLGVDPPMKISPATGKESYAFAKTDEDHKVLLEHENPDVQALVAARLALKSTIEETRAAAYWRASQLGPWPVDLNYSGAEHTHRMSGGSGGGGNPQNLKRGGVLRDSIEAPPGYIIITGDLRQVELRCTFKLAGENEPLERLQAGEDLYQWFAGLMYAKPESQVTKLERQIAKSACIAEGELVLTDAGLVPIEQVTLAHKVWDGVEWVAHSGIVFQGIQDVIEYDGLRATPDHRVHLQNAGWVRFDAAAEGGDSIARTADGGCPLRFLGSPFDGDTAARRQAYEDTLSLHELRSSYRSLGKQRLAHPRVVHSLFRMPKTHSASVAGGECRDFGETIRRYSSALQQSIAQVFFSVRRAWDQKFISFTQGFYSVRIGDFASQRLQGIGNRSRGQQQALRAGEFTISDAGSKLPESGNIEILRLQRKESADSARIPFSENTGPVSGLRSVLCSESQEQRRGDNTTDYRPLSQHNVRQAARTYDITNAGPRNRFTVSGRLVHNCLGLGFGMGWKTFYKYCRGLGIPITEDEAKKAVALYRDTFPRVCRLWLQCDRVLPAMFYDSEDYFFPQAAPLFKVESPSYRCGNSGIRLPSGLHLKYNMLHKSSSGQWGYSRKGLHPTIFGSEITANIVQAIAAEIFKEKLMQLHKILWCPLAVHDEAVVLCPVEKVGIGKQIVQKVMSSSPVWWPDLPLDTEVKASLTYGGAKT